MVYLFKSIPINEPFGLNTLDKDLGGQGSSPVELFTRGQSASALSSLEMSTPRSSSSAVSTLRGVQVILHMGYV